MEMRNGKIISDVLVPPNLPTLFVLKNASSFLKNVLPLSYNFFFKWITDYHTNSSHNLTIKSINSIYNFYSKFAIKKNCYWTYSASLPHAKQKVFKLIGQPANLISTFLDLFSNFINWKSTSTIKIIMKSQNRLKAHFRKGQRTDLGLY